jgi:membrane protein
MIDWFTKTLLPLLKLTAQKWQEDQCAEMGASLAYYTLFSLFPLLLVVLSIIGFAAGPDSGAREQILALASQSLPPSAYGTLEETLTSLRENRREVGIIGFVTLLLGASGFFGALDASFDKIWRPHMEESPANGLVSKVRAAAAKKALAFGLVLGSALLLLISMVAGVAVEVLLEAARGLVDGVPFVRLDDAWVLEVAQIGISFVMLALALVLLYRVLPTARIRFGDVWPGAVAAALLLLALQRLVVGGVVDLGASYRSYGVIGGVMLLLFWIYLTGQVLLLGAELSYAYATLHGSRRGRDEPQSHPATEVAAPSPPSSQQREAERADERAARAAGMGVLVGALGAVALSLVALLMGMARLLRALRRV